MLNHFAAPRLATLQIFFKTTSERELLGCYAWNQAVAAGMLPLLGDFEVALRNALHNALSQHFGGTHSFNWMLERPNPAHRHNPAAPVSLPSFHAMTPNTRQELSALKGKIQSKKGAHHLVTPDDIVAGLHFGFWEVLIKGLGHSSHPIGLQAHVLSSVFPHAPDTATNPFDSQQLRSRVTRLLQRLRDVRNRIGHHDALWATPEFDEQGVVGFIPRRPRHTIISYRLFCERLCWLAHWIDPKLSKHMRACDHWWSLHALLSRQALATYRTLGGQAGTYQAVLADTATPQDVRAIHRPKRHGHIARRIALRQYHF